MEDETLYRTILVPTDGSRRSRRAAEHAVDIARASGSTIHALYVMDVGDLDFVATPDDLAETRRRLERKGTEYTDAVRELAESAGVDCVTAVHSGIAPEEIVEYARENGVDLVVMGKRGRSDPDKPLLGSITNRVVRTADVPVQTV
ncbi:MAG: universal stress protein [Salinigranum sp.]